ncbi:hypothetical protein ABTY96_13910 [Streptomyces sp. NPDC096057]|uniref:hypothetical protein n=1 Tax=Streptomyces sp. NPDC096057 TaxID=3155543 RepID=UPI003330D39B
MKLVLFGATGTIAGRVAAACAPPRGGSPRSSEPGTGGGSDPRDPFLALDEALAADVHATGAGGLTVAGGADGPEGVPGRAVVPGPAVASGPVHAAGAGRLTVTGGAGGPEGVPGREVVPGPAVASGRALVSGRAVVPGRAVGDQPGFPGGHLPEARAHRAHRAVLAPSRALDDGPARTYASPTAEIAPGTRTGRLRVDEMERHTHPRARMPVAY